MAFHGMLCAAPSSSVRGLSRKLGSARLDWHCQQGTHSTPELQICRWSRFPMEPRPSPPWESPCPSPPSSAVVPGGFQTWSCRVSTSKPSRISTAPPHQAPEPLQNHPELPLRRSWKNRGRCQSVCSTSAFSHSS